MTRLRAICTAVALVCASGQVFADTASHNASAETFLKLANADRLGAPVYAQVQPYGLGICQVFAGGAIFRSVVFFPVLHEQAFHLITLLHEQYGGNGRVHAAGHADYDALHF